VNVIDVWTQQATKRFLAEPFFDSLKKWGGQNLDDVLLEFTLQSIANYEFTDSRDTPPDYESDGLW
jgi:hypothetical protein